MHCHICQEEINGRSFTIEFLSTANNGDISGTFFAEVCAACESEMSRELTEENEKWFGDNQNAIWA